MRWRPFLLLSSFLLGFPFPCLFLGGEITSHADPSSRSKCRLEVLQVLEATIGRGPPYLAQILRNNPQRAELITSESHGDHHLSCTYKILMNRRPYRYREEFPNTLLQLQESYCRTKEAKKKVRDSILGFTEQCKNPGAQPLLGNALELEP